MSGNGRQPARDFRDLEVWQQAHALVLEVYRLSRRFPRSECYGLTAQLRRAAVSVPANIAEGFRKRSKPDKVRFYNIAEGSVEEVHYYLILASDLGYADCTLAVDRVHRVSKLLQAYSRKILTSSS